MKSYLLLLLAAQAMSAANASAENPLPPVAIVFEHGRDGWPEYRIPALVATKKNTLLAFAEGRQSLSDHSENVIVLKRSLDGGRTWLPLQVVHEAGSNVLVNPCPVALASGRVLLMYQYFPAAFHSRNMGEKIKRLSPGLTGTNVSLTLLQWSDDDGATWSAPQNVTAQTKRPEVFFTFSGPGIGIQLQRGPHAGRILIPTGEGALNESHAYASISDDGGQTWRLGANAPGDAPISGEVQLVELSDGSVLLNVRDVENDQNKMRRTAVSHDGGETWSPLHGEPALPEPSCQASILRYSWPENGGSRILFANPASQTDRTNGTLRVSFDDGKTWPLSKVIYPGYYGYSCLVRLPDGSVGVLYETDGCHRIVFARFPLAWLTTALTTAPHAPPPDRVEANPISP